MNTAATVSRSSVALSLRCAGGGARSVSAQPPSASAEARSSTGPLGRIGLSPDRHRRSDPQRHADTKMRTGEFAIDDFDGPLMNVDAFVYHRKSDAGARHAAARCAPGVESLEDAGAFVERHAGSGVGNFENQLLTVGLRAQIDDAAARRVLDGVGEQVLNDEAYLAPVRRHGEIF